MRTKTVIFILLSSLILVMAEPTMPFFKNNGKHGGGNDSTVVSDTAVRQGADASAAGDTLPADTADMPDEPDTTKMDSLTLAIYKHNKQIDDSIRLDSINRRKSNSLDAPVDFMSDDSLVYDAMTKRAYLYVCNGPGHL